MKQKLVYLVTHFIRINIINNILFCALASDILSCHSRQLSIDGQFYFSNFLHHGIIAEIVLLQFLFVGNLIIISFGNLEYVNFLIMNEKVLLLDTGNYLYILIFQHIFSLVLLGNSRLIFYQLLFFYPKGMIKLGH